MRKIRVLQADALSKNIGGGDVYLKEQYCNIDREKIQYDFLTPYGKEMAFYDEIISLGGNVYYKNWGGKGSRWNPLTYYRWYKFFKAHPYDIVVLNAMSLLNIDSILFAKLFKVPVRIIHSHNAFAEKYTNSFIRNWLIKYNEKNIMKFATHLFACSDAAGKWMFGDQFFYVIRNGINVNKFKFNVAIRQEVRKKMNLTGRFVVGHVGRFDYQKNHSFLIDIFAEIYKKKSNAVLLLVGLEVVPELAKEIREKVSKLGISSCVFFLGMRKDTHELMQAMDIFLFPSLFEGLGIVLIEAQIAGLKCFTTKDVVPNDVNITELVQFISLQDSTEQWANQILNHEHYNRGDQSESMIKAGYSAKDSANWVEKFYIDTVDKSKNLKA